MGKSGFRGSCNLSQQISQLLTGRSSMQGREGVVLIL